MKRILIFSLAYYPSHVSGAESAIKDTTERIDPSDIEFHLITLLFDSRVPREEIFGHVHVHRVGAGGAYLSKVLFIPLAAWKARSLHKKLHFDGVWTMMTYMLFPTMLSKWLGVEVPHALSLQDGDPYDKVFKRAFIKPLVPVLDAGFRSARIVQAISHYLAEWPAKRGYHGPVEIIYDGANPRDLKETPNPVEVERVRRELGKEEGDVYLVNTARLVYQKGNDTTIRAVPLLPKHIKLVLVGGGPDEAMLRSLAKELKVESRVIFTGSVDRSVVTLYRQACDIFVGPSRSEGQGHAFNSAMASRLPVITTQEGGLAEFIFGEQGREPQTAWPVPKDDPQAIAHAVEDILAHPDKVREVTARAHALTLEKFDWDKIAVQMRERVFARVLA